MRFVDRFAAMPSRCFILRLLLLLVLLVRWHRFFRRNSPFLHELFLDRIPGKNGTQFVSPSDRSTGANLEKSTATFEVERAKDFCDPLSTGSSEEVRGDEYTDDSESRCLSDKLISFRDVSKETEMLNLRKLRETNVERRRAGCVL